MPEKHYFEQKKHAVNYLIPYFKKYIPNLNELNILEIGCAEAGLLEELQNLGANPVGLEISNKRAELAKEKNPSLKIYVGDISDKAITNFIAQKFDMIILREVIEHIHDKESTFENIDKLLLPGGYLYVSFPPKFSGFAGHQQVGRSPIKYIPYVHLLPKPLIKFMVKTLNEYPHFVNHLEEHYSTGCTIGTFEKLYKKRNMKPLVKELFLFRPIYNLRFGLPIVKSVNIPLIREVLSFGCETLLKK